MTCSALNKPKTSLRNIILIAFLLSITIFIAVFVVSSKVDNSSSKVDNSSSANWSTYEKQGLIKFKYPLQWRVLPKADKEKLGSQFIDILYKDKSEIYMGLRNIAVENPSSADLQEVSSGLDEMLPKSFTDFQKIDAQVINIDDSEALEYIFTFKKDNAVMKQRLLTIISSQTFYVNFWGKIKNIDQEKSEIDNIIKTLEL